MLLPKLTHPHTGCGISWFKTYILCYACPNCYGLVALFIYSRLILNDYTELLELRETKIPAQAFLKCLCFPPECLYYPG